MIRDEERATWFDPEAEQRFLEDEDLDRQAREHAAREVFTYPEHDPDDRWFDARGLKSAGTDDLEAWK